MHLNQRQNINYLFFITLLASYCLSCLSQSAIAAPKNKSFKSPKNKIDITLEKNTSLDLHLILSRFLVDEEEITDFEAQQDFSLAESEVVPSPSEPYLIATGAVGQASWYGPGFHGRRTASGEIFNQYALTAAHRYYRFGTRVRVTNLHNGRTVIVRINDRGPYAKGRIIDLSQAAASSIGLLQSGVAPVRVEIIGR